MGVGLPQGVLKSAMNAPFTPAWFEDMVLSSGSFSARDPEGIPPELAGYLGFLSDLAKRRQRLEVGMLIQPSKPGGWEWVDAKIRDDGSIAVEMSAFSFTNCEDCWCPSPRAGAEWILRERGWRLFQYGTDGTRFAPVTSETDIRTLSQRKLSEDGIVLAFRRTFATTNYPKVAQEIMLAAQLSYGLRDPRTWWIQGHVKKGSGDCFVDFRKVREWLGLAELSPNRLPAECLQATTALELGLSHLVTA
jgi:hypothetical protein